MHTAFLLFSKKTFFLKHVKVDIQIIPPIKYHYKKKSEKQNVESVTFLGNLWKAVRTKHLYSYT